MIYVFTSIVSFGVLPGSRLQAHDAPMAEVASVYLPPAAPNIRDLRRDHGNYVCTEWDGDALRMGIMLSSDRLARWLGYIILKQLLFEV